MTFDFFISSMILSKIWHQRLGAGIWLIKLLTWSFASLLNQCQGLCPNKIPIEDKMSNKSVIKMSAYWHKMIKYGQKHIFDRLAPVDLFKSKVISVFWKLQHAPCTRIIEDGPNHQLSSVSFSTYQGNLDSRIRYQAFWCTWIFSDCNFWSNCYNKNCSVHVC